MLSCCSCNMQTLPPGNVSQCPDRRDPVWSFLSARSSLPFSDLWNQQDIFSAARWIVSVNPRDVCVGKSQSVSSFIQTSCHQCCSLAIFSPLYTTSSVLWFHRNVWWKLWTPLLNTSLIWRNTTEQKSSHLELNLINTVTISPYWHQVVLTQFVSRISQSQPPGGAIMQR